MIVEPAKNGPKGISDFKVFFFKTIKIMETKAPIKKAKNKATKILGQPRINPINKANFMSPTPIHLPLETKTMARKKAPAARADRKAVGPDTKYQIPATNMAG